MQVNNAIMWSFTIAGNRHGPIVTYRVGLVSQFSSFKVGACLRSGLLHSINNLVFDLPFIDNKLGIFGRHHNGDRWLCRPSPSGCGDSTQAWIASQLFVKRCWMRMGVGFGCLCMRCCVVTQDTPTRRYDTTYNRWARYQRRNQSDLAMHSNVT